MLHRLTRLLSTAADTCRHAAGSPATPAALRCLSISAVRWRRDYALPNASWGRHLQALYDHYIQLSSTGAWKRIPSFNNPVHYIGDTPVEAEQVSSRLFTRNIEGDGLGFEYCMFYSQAEKRMVCLFQPGPYLEGPPGYTHGGCIATIIDSTVGAGAVYNCGRVMTANLKINYRSPIPLGSTVIIDSQVEKIEGRKVYTHCQVRSHDDAILHADATGLFIKVGQGEEDWGAQMKS